MSVFELKVNHWKGHELDCTTFDLEKDAEDYYSAEWGDSDSVADHSITMIDENGNRSIFDDVDAKTDKQ